MTGKNNQPRFVMSGFVCLLLVLAPGFFIGCGTTPKQASFATLQEIAQTADKALSAYYDMVVAGKIDQATQAKVRDIKGRYQKAMNAAIAAARGNTWTTAPQDVQDLANMLAQVIEAAKGKT